jgi:signal peptidase II
VEKNKNYTFLIPLITIFLVVFFDQWLKVYIKTNFTLGQEINVLGNWFKIHFTENPGMAFGWTFGGNIGKYFLTIFRIIASVFIVFFIIKLIKEKKKNWVIFWVSLILAGALGNIIDSVFYGKWFTESTFHTAAIFNPKVGYAPLFMGKVVDMLYFPIIDTYWPEFIPIIGGSPFQFFRPVFNIADAAISTGIICILLFNRKELFVEKELENDHIDEAQIEGDTEQSPSI